jgi:hypothetical protein
MGKGKRKAGKWHHQEFWNDHTKYDKETQAQENVTPIYTANKCSAAARRGKVNPA